jgi:hypothetical protein
MLGDHWREPIAALDERFHRQTATNCQAAGPPQAARRDKPVAPVAVSQSHHSLSSVTASAVPCNERITMQQCQLACGIAALCLASGVARYLPSCERPTSNQKKRS